SEIYPWMDCPNGPFPKPPAPLPGLPLGVTPSKASAKLPPFYLPTKFFTRFFAEKYVKKHTLLTCRYKPGGYKQQKNNLLHPVTVGGRLSYPNYMSNTGR
ncbi:MAG: hypothetical protein J6C44_09435, partial [Muribaculaceae bacterium]|nr:hypothetical protein [Muribaculaceae bacterium]